MAEDSGDKGKGTRKAWDQVGQHFSEVGRRISERFREERGETAPTSDAQRRALNDALKEAVDKLDQTFTSLGNALRDPETNEGLKRAGRSLGDALNTTFSDLSGEIKRRVGRKGSPGNPDRPEG